MHFKLWTSLAVAGLLALPASALAAADDTQITLSGGNLSYTTPFTAENFANTTITGLPQTVRATVNPWKVTDARGSLAGWNVTVKASQFTDNNGTTATTTDDKTLPHGSLSLVNLGISDITTALANLSVPPVPQAVAVALDNQAGTAQKLVTAALAGGAGEWTFTPDNTSGGDLVLVVPPDAQAGTYKSTITTTLSTGP